MINDLVTYSARRFSAFVFLLFLLSPAISFAATYNVNSTNDELDAVRDGVCETATGNGVCTLRAAITESNAALGADIINLPAGVYLITRPGTSGDFVGSFDIRDDLTIEGAGASTTVIDGGTLDSVLTISGASKIIRINGVTIQNGSVSAFRSGGGINVARSIVTLTDVVVQNNHAGDGGGISNQGNMTLVRSVVRGNTAIREGLDGMVYRKGGGILHTGGVLTLRDSAVEDNIAVAGGGIYSIGSVVVETSTISGNISTNMTHMNGEGGAGVMLDSSNVTLSITNSTVSGNRANSHHGGLFVRQGRAQLSNATVTDNIADADGDGFGSAGGLSLGNTATATLRNSIIAGNRAAGPAVDCSSLNAGALASAGYNLIGNTGPGLDCVYAPGTGDGVGNSSSPLDAGLQPLANNGGRTRTHALGSNSPALDGGNAEGCRGADGLALTTDQRGVGRAFDGGSGSARCDIGAYEQARPAARAGDDRRVNVGTIIVLDGTASTSPNGAASYTWHQISGAPVNLENANTPTARFVATDAGELVFQLTIADSLGLTSNDAVAISVNAPPQASAGFDQAVQTGAAVRLDGTGSRDGDGTIVTYAWTQIGGTPVTLTGANTPSANFAAPASAGTLIFQLAVTDNEGATGTASVRVDVEVPNAPPTANAGADQTVNAGATVMLNGTASSDPDGAIAAYSWVQVSGAVVSLTGAGTVTPSFVAPATGVLVFRLTVTDEDGAAHSDDVSITVSAALPSKNLPPIANAGSDRRAKPWSWVMLNGSASRDPDGRIAGYQWVQTGGPRVTIFGDGWSHAFFLARGEGVYTFQLTVVDNKGARSTDTVKIIVDDCRRRDRDHHRGHHHRHGCR